MFQNLKSYDENRASFKTWTVKICVNKCFKFNQKGGSNQFIEFNAEHHGLTVDPEVISKMSDAEMLLVLKQMPQEFYQVFNLFAVDGFNHDEIAATLSISTDLSRQRLSRARKWIKEKTTLVGAFQAPKVRKEKTEKKL